MIAIHAERVTGDERTVRWVIPAGTLAIGRVRSAPGRLGELLAEGTLSDALVEHTAVWLWLHDGDSWSNHAAAVQDALRVALAEPSCWVIDAAPGEVLARVTSDLLTGSVGDFVRSHGGSVRVDRIDDGISVRLGGACEHCPAAGYTLRQRLVGELRRRCPNLVEVNSGDKQLTLALSGTA